MPHVGALLPKFVVVRLLPMRQQVCVHEHAAHRAVANAWFRTRSRPTPWTQSNSAQVTRPSPGTQRRSMGTQRPAVWLPAGGVGGDRPRRHPQAGPNHGCSRLPHGTQTPRASESTGWGRVQNAATVSRSTRSPRPRQAAIPPRRSAQREPLPAAPAMATEGQTLAVRHQSHRRRGGGAAAAAGPTHLTATSATQRPLSL